MSLITGLIILIALILGFSVQNLLRWSPWANLGLSFLAIFLFPPFWSLGLIVGTWVSCAFFTYKPESERHYDSQPPISWPKVLLCSCWVFAGFLLTLLFLWRLKTGSSALTIGQQEIWAWVFLIAVEMCLYKIIGCNTPFIYRIPLGYGIALCNFLLLFFWLYSISIMEKIMVLFLLFAASPILLVYTDRSYKEA